MTTFDITSYNSDREADIKAEARVSAFFSLKKAWKFRKARGLLASDLAAVLKKDKGYVSRLLNGSARTMTLETLFVFLEALGHRIDLDVVPFEMVSQANFDARPHITEGKAIDHVANPMVAGSVKNVRVPLENRV